MTFYYIVQTELAHITLIRAEFIPTINLTIIDASLCIWTLTIDEIIVIITFAGFLQIK